MHYSERYINQSVTTHFKFAHGIWDVSWADSAAKSSAPHGYYPDTVEGRIKETIKESKHRKYYDRTEFIECYNIINRNVQTDLKGQQRKYQTGSDDPILDLEKLKGLDFILFIYSRKFFLDFEKDMEILQRESQAGPDSRKHSIEHDPIAACRQESKLAKRQSTLLFTNYMTRVSTAKQFIKRISVPEDENDKPKTKNENTQNEGSNRRSTVVSRPNFDLASRSTTCMGLPPSLSLELKISYRMLSKFQFLNKISTIF